MNKNLNIGDKAKLYKQVILHKPYAISMEDVYFGNIEIVDKFIQGCFVHYSYMDNGVLKHTEITDRLEKI